MFDRAIIDTMKFMDLPISTKALYFLMGMEADDEGFVSPKKVLRIHGGSDDDIKVLISKDFVIPFESGVVVITDWNKNNWLDSRRIRETEYKKEKALLSLTEDKTYLLSNCLADVKPEQNRVEENRIEQKKSVGEFKNVQLREEELAKLIERYGRSAVKQLVDELSTYLKSSGKRYKDHYATLLNWARRKGVVEIAKPITPKEEEPLTEEQKARNKEMLKKIANITKRM